MFDSIEQARAAIIPKGGERVVPLEKQRAIQTLPAESGLHRDRSNFVARLFPQEQPTLRTF